MEESQHQHEGGDSNRKANEGSFVPCEQYHGHEGSTPKSRNHQEKAHAGRFRWPSAQAWFDLFLVLFTGALVVTSYLQWHALSETLVETRKLVEATQIQANAAHQAIITAIELAHQEQRPWVGLRDFQCQGCTAGADGMLTIDSLLGVMENTGRTPAINMRVSAAWTNRKGQAQLPDYDSVQRETMERLHAVGASGGMQPSFQPPETVLPPNTTRIIPILYRATIDVARRGPLENRIINYVVGKITYFSTWEDKEHLTIFCLMNESSVQFRFCPSGNRME
jgi:hypothetical protein